MPEKPIAPRKAPRQARASATVEVILEAATRVLAAHSLAGFNTNRVAEVFHVLVTISSSVSYTDCLNNAQQKLPCTQVWSCLGLHLSGHTLAIPMVADVC